MPASYRLIHDRRDDASEINAILAEADAPEFDDYEAEMVGRCDACGYGHHECACDDLPELVGTEREPLPEGTPLCLCCDCREMLSVGDDIVQNPVYKCGELSYIELAHRGCVPEWAANDDWQG